MCTLIAVCSGEFLLLLRQVVHFKNDDCDYATNKCTVSSQTYALHDKRATFAYACGLVQKILFCLASSALGYFRSVGPWGIFGELTVLLSNSQKQKTMFNELKAVHAVFVLFICLIYID